MAKPNEPGGRDEDRDPAGRPAVPGAPEAGDAGDGDPLPAGDLPPETPPEHEPGEERLTGPDSDPLADPSAPPDGDPTDPEEPGDERVGGDEEPEEHGRSGFAATALKVLIFVIVIFGLSLWLVPNVAPHLPNAVGRHLMPAQAALDERLAELSARIEASTSQLAGQVAAMQQNLAQISSRLDAVQQTAQAAQGSAEAAKESAAQSAQAAKSNAVAGDAVARAEQAAREANGMADTATTAATEAGKVASAAQRDTASLARRMTDFESRVAALSDQIGAVSETLAKGGQNGQPTDQQIAAAVAGLKAEVDNLREKVAQTANYITASEAQRFATQDDLRSARTALRAELGQALSKLPEPASIVTGDELDALRSNFETKVSQVIDRVDSVQATAAQAAQSAQAAEQAATSAVGNVGQAIRQASLRSAAASMTSRLVNGLPYAGALQEVQKLIGTPPPEALAKPAGTGVATSAELLRRFGQPARAAQQAAMEASAGGGFLARAKARVSTVVSGRPANELPGDTVEAILSRVEARLRDDDPAAALAEAKALPAPAQQALGGWLGDLETRVAAAQAADAYLGPAGGSASGSAAASQG